MQMNRLLKKLDKHDSKGKLKELRHEVRELRTNSDLNTRQGQSKIDRNAEEEAMRFRNQRWKTYS